MFNTILDGATYSVEINIEPSSWGATAYVFIGDKDFVPERAQISVNLPDIKSAKLWSRLNFPGAKVHVQS